MNKIDKEIQEAKLARAVEKFMKACDKKYKEREKQILANRFDAAKVD